MTGIVCGRPAKYRYVWPGGNPCFICEECSPRIANAATARGFAVELVPCEQWNMICGEVVFDRPAAARTLRDRCAEFLDPRNRILEPSADELVAFVLAETGRTADLSLDQSLPLVLYFGSAIERREFVAMMAARRNLTMRVMP